MRSHSTITLSDLLIGLALGGLVVVLAAATLSSASAAGARGAANKAVCMANLSSIGKGLFLYKSANENRLPWISDKITGWDTTKVGTNRSVNPFGPNDGSKSPKPRSITALMFLLVRADQAARLFRCPDDANWVEDKNIKADRADGDVEDGGYYWDFSTPDSVSYSMQAPLHVSEAACANGLAGADKEVVALADMTPRYAGRNWQPISIDDQTPQSELEKQISANHRGEQVNALRLAGNVVRAKRPDIGVSQDNIYTAFGDDFTMRRKATSTSLSDHKSKKDTFLIGPVGRPEK